MLNILVLSLTLFPVIWIPAPAEWPLCLSSVAHVIECMVKTKSMLKLAMRVSNNYNKPFSLWSEFSNANQSKFDIPFVTLKKRNFVLCMSYICCCTCAQLFLYEALGLCPEGKGGDLVDSGHWIHNKNGRSDTSMWVCGYSGLFQ